MKLHHLLVIISLLATVRGYGADSDEYAAWLDSLDVVLADSPRYDAEKEETISNVRRRLGLTTD